MIQDKMVQNGTKVGIIQVWEKRPSRFQARGQARRYVVARKGKENEKREPTV